VPLTKPDWLLQKFDWEENPCSPPKFLFILTDMKSRFSLINTGLYPETLPPCFVSRDAKRAFHGMVGTLDEAQFHEKRTDFVPYSGTKHDGSRRSFGTPNILSYFQISSFIWKNWDQFKSNYALSEYSIGVPSILSEADDRAVKVPSLSELSKHTSKNLKYAPYILKADISQCFPSIYTHSIAWAAHGIDASKSDTDKKSRQNLFNGLDFFVRNAQRGNTRGVLIGPDGYRLIAEFVLARLDDELKKVVGDKIVGAVRHVDDYYIGLRTEHDAQSVLSHLREVLGTYALNLNDQKTRIYSSLDPINDLWAQRLRDHTQLDSYFDEGVTKLERAITEAVVTAREIGSDSPIKILFRSFDEGSVFQSSQWGFIEQNMLRIVQKHAHAIDYACLLVAKRFASGMVIDSGGWLSVAEIIINRGLAYNHHHEVAWMLWLLIVCKIPISAQLIEEIAKSKNSHIRAMLVQASVEGKIKIKLKLALGGQLSTSDSTWLVNLVSRSQNFSKAAFSGTYAAEFEHLATKGIRLINFDDHMERVAIKNKHAISRTRYGYDGDEDEDDENDWGDLGF
jgi:hypothetical protein